MGLISELLLLPLAPVRGTVWLAEVIQEQAENELYDEADITTALAELEAARDAGDFSEEEIEEAENALLERLMTIRGFREQEDYGEGQ
jgi:hypothetical protein